MKLACFLFAQFLSVALFAAASLTDLAESRDAAGVKKAIAAGVDVNKPNAQGRTALMIAVQKNDVEIVKLLLHAGAKIEIQDKYDLRTALALAVQHEAVASGKLLLAANANVHARDIYGMTPLMIATHREKHRAGDAEFSLLLIGSGADVNATVDRGMTCLMYAIAMDERVLKAFIAAKADINAQTRWGETALMSAASRGYASRVKLLLEAGADPNLRDEKGNSALSLARVRGFKEIEKILVTAGAKP